MKDGDILLWTKSHRNTVYRRRLERQFIAQYFYIMLRIYTSNCFPAWSVFVWYAIKIDIRPRPVSIFSDYSAIKENIYVMLRKQAGKWQR